MDTSIKDQMTREMAGAKKRGACQALGLCRNGVGPCYHCKRSNGEIAAAQRERRENKITAIWMDEPRHLPTT